MVTDFEKLLEATIAHVEGLKSQGVQFVPVATPTLEALRRPAPAQPGLSPPRAHPHPPWCRPSSWIRRRAPLDRAAKEAAMAELRARALVCQKCGHLAAARKKVVFGVGDIHSPLDVCG
jgi:hypothetical protein